MDLQIRFFGHLQVSEGPASLTHRLPARSQRLLAYLLLRRRAPVAREAAAFTLWPDNTETESLGALRRSLNELRAALPAADGCEWIIAAHGELQWNPDAPYWLDSEEFERGLRQSTPAALHNAINLYTGDLLPELGDEWAVVERERLRQCYFDALAQMAAHHRALGEYETAVDLTRRVLAIEPLAEAAHRDLIALHYLTGDRASALAAYERLCAGLRTELGVEPMAETQDLFEAVADGRPLPALAPRLPGAKTEKKDTPKPIGRETEMAGLAALWESAADGHGRCVVVSGEAGVGKSHLINSLADYAATRGGLALTGHCYEFEHALPYQAVVEMLRSAAAVISLADLPLAHRASLARLAPDVLGAAGGPQMAADDESRAQLFEAFLQAFLSLSRSQPLLLLIEDAHWASESTLDWLTYAAPRMAEGRALVVITYRTGEVGAGHALARLQRRFAREGAAVVLPLAPLSPETCREWVARMSGLEEEPASAVADRLFAETAGNPFFLQEVVRRLIEADQIVVARGRWSGSFVEAAPGARVPLPESLRGTISARVARLDEASESFIRAAAVAGRVFEYEVVRRAGRWDEEAALDALEDLLARKFIRPGETDTGAFAFEHHLVREAIYADLAAPRRSYWHRHIALAIEALRPADDTRLGDLAYQFFHGQEWEKAATYAGRAARQAEGRYADDEAIHYFRQALDALSHLPDSADARARRFEILLPMERAADRRANRELEGELLNEMLTLALDLKDDARIARAQTNFGQYLRMTGRPIEALDALKEAQERAAEAVQAGQVEAGITLASAYGLAGSVVGMLGRYANSRDYFKRALVCYEELSLPPEFPVARFRFAAHRNLADMLRWEGRFQEALDQCGIAIDGLQNTDGAPRYEFGLTLNLLGWIYADIGAIDLSRRALGQAREIIEAAGIRTQAAYSDMLFGKLRHREGQMGGGEDWLAESRALFERALAEFRALDAPHSIAVTLPLMAALESAEGNSAAAENLLAECLELARRSNFAMHEITALAGIAACRLAAGDSGGALRASSEALSQFESLAESSQSEPFVYYTHYRALAAANDPAARAQLEQAHRALCRQADELRDLALRECLLNNGPAHREIVEAWK